jgi:23S rRNA (adenine2030-N6)-methyltransferase
MNYRHHYHAGNFADVFKHVLLMQLVQAMKRKEKGFLYLDTHAGRGSYDLSIAPILPDGRERQPEWPQGIGRVWGETTGPLAAYFSLVLQFNLERGGPEAEPRHYPGSPWIAKMLLRPQDRMALCELRPDDAEALDFEFAREERVKVEVIDGYTGLKALLPPPEKRALVLIDPPFETKKEFADIARGLKDALKRLPGAVIAVWYPITERARTDEFHHALVELATPALFAELNIAGVDSLLKMKGCGLLILNPPWQLDREIRALLPVLREKLRVDAGASTACNWLVPDQ